jgi:hypothetical protein
MLQEAYRPIIEDGRGKFPEDFRVKAPRGMRQAIAEAAELDNTTQAEWARQASGAQHTLSASAFLIATSPNSATCFKSLWPGQSLTVDWGLFDLE